MTMENQPEPTKEERDRVLKEIGHQLQVRLKPWKHAIVVWGAKDVSIQTFDPEEAAPQLFNASLNLTGAIGGEIAGLANSLRVAIGILSAPIDNIVDPGAARREFESGQVDREAWQGPLRLIDEGRFNEAVEEFVRQAYVLLAHAAERRKFAEEHPAVKAMPVPFEPEPLAKLQARFSAALRIWDAAAIVMHIRRGEDCDRPMKHRRHVFDCEDGLRIGLNGEMTRGEGLHLHGSVSISDDTTALGKRLAAMPITERTATVLDHARERLAMITGIQDWTFVGNSAVVFHFSAAYPAGAAA